MHFMFYATIKKKTATAKKDQFRNWDEYNNERQDHYNFTDGILIAFV